MQPLSSLSAAPPADNWREINTAVTYCGDNAQSMHCRCTVYTCMPQCIECCHKISARIKVQLPLTHQRTLTGSCSCGHYSSPLRGPGTAPKLIYKREKQHKSVVLSVGHSPLHTWLITPWTSFLKAWIKGTIYNTEYTSNMLINWALSFRCCRTGSIWT